MKYYKFLDTDGSTRIVSRCYDTTAQYALTDGFPTKWYSVEGPLAEFDNGILILRRQDLAYYCGPLLLEVEACGETLPCRDKVIARKIRLLSLTVLNDRAWRLYGCDCAARALQRSRNPERANANAIRVARTYAQGDASRQELEAARNGAVQAVCNPAFVVTCATAYIAGWEAAITSTASADDEEREWQIERLLAYAYNELLEDIPLPDYE